MRKLNMAKLGVYAVSIAIAIVGRLIIKKIEENGRQEAIDIFKHCSCAPDDPSEVTDDYHSFKIVPDSDAEVYFMNLIVPKLNEKHICRLGGLFGMPYNEYLITNTDYERLRYVCTILETSYR